MEIANVKISKDEAFMTLQGALTGSTQAHENLIGDLDFLSTYMFKQMMVRRGRQGVALMSISAQSIIWFLAY